MAKHDWKRFTEDAVDAPIVVRHRQRQDTEMDITPMIDIVFLLLIFFIVTTRIDSQSSVQQPQAVHGTAVSQKLATIITVEQRGDETLVFLGNGVDGPPLSSNIREQEANILQAIEEGKRAGKHIVLVKAGEDVRHGEVSRVSAIVGLVDGVELRLGVEEKQRD